MDDAQLLAFFHSLDFLEKSEFHLWWAEQAADGECLALSDLPTAFRQYLGG